MHREGAGRFLGAIGGQLDPDVRAGAISVGGMRAASMSARNRLDDCEAEPCAIAASGGIAPAEALEGPTDEAGGESRAAVLDVDRHLAAGFTRADGDLAPAVLDRVLDQVGERLLEA